MSWLTLETILVASELKVGGRGVAKVLMALFMALTRSALSFPVPAKVDFLSMMIWLGARLTLAPQAF